MERETEEKVIDESVQGKALTLNVVPGAKKRVYIESYGCQMNFSDSEIVASILHENGYQTTADIGNADVVLVNTCSIREKAEQTVRKRISAFNNYKAQNPEMVVGVLGCMAERLKSKLLDEEKLVDLVVGPDAYRELPSLLGEAEDGNKAVNVILSKEETYDNIEPVRLGGNGVTAFISIMRGCDNMCTFCVVPFTRGRERSRDPETIVQEAKDLFNKGYREVTLLGQNVDSYLWYGGGPKKNFSQLDEKEKESSVNFARLLELVAGVNPQLRIRFSTSNPQDMTDYVLHAMARHENICKYIHLPLQAGNSRVLEMMNRGYNREEYMDRIKAINEIIPDCAISTDVITGFCSETDDEHKETLEVMEAVKYHFAYMFKYSERPNTMAARKFEDDVPEKAKNDRLQEVIALQQTHSLERNQADVGKVHEVLIEGTSKRSDDQLFGRTSQNSVCVFPKENFKPGQYVKVRVDSCTSATLIGEVVKEA